MYGDERSDDLLTEEIEAALRSPQARGVVKAILIGVMMLYSVFILDGSFLKALITSAIFCLIACFNTWRRYMEIPVFLLFCGATIYMCNEQVFHWIASIVFSPKG